MSVRRPSMVRRAAASGLGLVLVLAMVRVASAQHFDTDPYHPWNSDTMPFATPAAPPNFALPNQARFRGGRDFMPRGNGPGRLESYYNGVDAALGNPMFGLPGGGGLTAPFPLGVPAGNGSSQVFIPNAEVDAQYYQERMKREELYLKAREEADPKKRAELLKQYDEATRKAARELSYYSRRFPSQAGGSPAAGTRRPARSAPPPIPESGTGRPTSNYSVRRIAGASRPSQPTRTPVARARPVAPAAPPARRAGLLPDLILERSRRMGGRLTRSPLIDLLSEDPSQPPEIQGGPRDPSRPARAGNAPPIPGVEGPR